MIYHVYELIGNYSTEVFKSEDFYEVEDYLRERYEEYLSNDNIKDSEEECQLFYSYFSIKED